LAAGTTRCVAITMDDFGWQQVPSGVVPRVPANEAILNALDGYRLKAALFVIGRNIENPAGQALLQAWNDRGHIIGNHTYSHQLYTRTGEDPSAYFADIEHCERVLVGYSRFRKLFRFPMLKEGKTPGQRDAMRRYLHEKGYRNGHVTIDASDWYYDTRLRGRLSREPDFDVRRFREPYIRHILDRAEYYDGLARDLGYANRTHTVLLHFNLINALFLGDVLSELKRTGWRLEDAEAAFRDPIFREEPSIVPAGESLMWALAKQSGRFEGKLRYPGEDGEYEKPILDRLGL
jgi:peptidoglycan/xylan/chitin deacetylase (PgdA/CDA1 family)